MIVSYIIGLISGFIISIAVYKYINNKNIKNRLEVLDKSKNYINSLSNDIQELIQFVLNYIDHENPSDLLKKEVKKVLRKEAKKWGVKNDDTNIIWTNIRNNISNRTNSSNRKSKSDD